MGVQVFCKTFEETQELSWQHDLELLVDNLT